ncbi:MAG TPA: exodeoxyribonuclease VII small subunit [Gammaproteobacteria bacterium]
MAKKTVDSFENDLQALETLVEKLERGDLPLEDSLQQFERGIALARRCQQALKTAEQKVRILLEKNAEAEPETFDASSTDNHDPD